MKTSTNRWIGLVRRALWALLPLGPHRQVRWRPVLPSHTALNLPGRGRVEVRIMNGPPGSSRVLLLHGVTWSGDVNFHALVDALAEHHTVITVDHRGHGRGLPASEPYEMADLADDAVAVLDALHVSEVIVGGFSLGSLTALHLGLRHPDRVRGLVLSAGALVLRTHPAERAALRVPALAFRLLGTSRLGRSAGARYFGLNRAARDPRFREAWPWLRCELERHFAADVGLALDAAAGHDLRGQVGPLRTIPAVVVAHTYDHVIPVSLQHAMADEIGADVISIATDHEAPLSHPEIYRDAMTTAIARVEALAVKSEARRAGGRT